jgi:hypothetical protein
MQYAVSRRSCRHATRERFLLMDRQGMGFVVPGVISELGCVS